MEKLNFWAPNKPLINCQHNKFQQFFRSLFSSFIRRLLWFRVQQQGEIFATELQHIKAWKSCFTWSIEKRDIWTLCLLCFRIHYRLTRINCVKLTLSGAEVTVIVALKLEPDFRFSNYKVWIIKQWIYYTGFISKTNCEKIVFTLAGLKERCSSVKMRAYVEGYRK